MRQYDVCELNISTIVEISDESFMRAHLQSQQITHLETLAGARK